jgi:hypothetical protein
MLRKIHGTNFFHIKYLGSTNIKCQNKPVLPPAQVFYFNGQALRHPWQKERGLLLCSGHHTRHKIIRHLILCFGTIYKNIKVWKREKECVKCLVSDITVICINGVLLYCLYFFYVHQTCE